MNKPELVSFDLCPFVQRSVITLLEKNVDFDITYIDLDHKPEWFLKISPFGKVPLLKVDRTVIFESAVINEYLDEVTLPSMHPSDTLRKAHNRAWIEFASTLLMNQYTMVLANTKESYKEARNTMVSNLQKVEDQLGEGPFFNGQAFNLVDAAFAPFFMRLEFIADETGQDFLEDLPKTLQWHCALLKRESVQRSVIPNIKAKFLRYIEDKESYLSKLLLESYVMT